MPASFHDALEKLSYRLKPRAKQEVKVERHFESADPNWSEFEKNLRSPVFQKLVKAHPQADEKLKRYTDQYGGYLRSKDVVAKMVSKDSGKTYRIKKVGDRLACGCKDWQYKRSHGGGDCKHIQAMAKPQTKFSEMVKQSFLSNLKTALYGTAYMRHQGKKHWRLGQQTAAFAKQKRDEEQQRFLGT